jgi:predicted alpha/beta hydrolase family esterase
LLGESKKKVKKLILVAPWKVTYREDRSDKAFYGYEINSSVKSNIKEIIIFSSDNEEEGGKRSAKMFHESLGGKLIELKGKGHYVLEDMGTEEFPELLQEILK